jgi:hypothetical protein
MLKMTPSEMLQIELPEIPTDQQTPEFLVDWFSTRLPFTCITRQDLATGDWYFERRPFPWDVAATEPPNISTATTVEREP